MTSQQIYRKYRQGCHLSGNCQGKAKFLKVREFFFESGKIDILKKGQGKCKNKINMADFIPLKAGRNNWGHSDLYYIFFCPKLISLNEQ